MTIRTDQTTVRQNLPVRDVRLQESEIVPIVGEEFVVASPYGNAKKKNKQRKPVLLPTDGRQNFQLAAKEPKKGVEKLLRDIDVNSSKSSAGVTSAGDDPSVDPIYENDDFSYSTLTGSGVALSILAIIDAMNSQLEAALYKKEQSLSMMEVQYTSAERTSNLTKESAAKEKRMAHLEAFKQFTGGAIGLAGTGYSLGTTYSQNKGFFDSKGTRNEIEMKRDNQQAHLDRFNDSTLGSTGTDLVIGGKARPADPAAGARYDRQQRLLDGTDPRLDEARGGAKLSAKDAAELDEDYRLLSKPEQQTVRDKIDEKIKNYDTRMNTISNTVNSASSNARMLQDLLTQFTGGTFDFYRGNVSFEKGLIDAEKVMVDLAQRIAGETISQYTQGATENDRQALDALSLLRQMQQANEVRG